MKFPIGTICRVGSKAKGRLDWAQKHGSEQRKFQRRFPTWEVLDNIIVEIVDSHPRDNTYDCLVRTIDEEYLFLCAWHYLCPISPLEALALEVT